EQHRIIAMSYEKLAQDHLALPTNSLEEAHHVTRYVTLPPSTGMATPVTKEAASEQSQTTTSATSSGIPSRPIGTRAANSASISAFSAIPCSTMLANHRSAIGVRVAPGQMALMRIP